jgi:hypothetical protein
MSEDLRSYNISVLSLTPCCLRSEEIPEGFSVTGANWIDCLIKEGYD